jgi:hypothetical protein
MKTKVHPVVAVLAVVLVLAGVGFYLSRAFNSGVVGKTYAPGEVPKTVNQNLDTEPDAATARDAAQTRDPDGK